MKLNQALLTVYSLKLRFVKDMERSDIGGRRVRISLRWGCVSPFWRGIRPVKVTIIRGFFLLGLILDNSTHSVFSISLGVWYEYSNVALNGGCWNLM